MIEPYNDSSDEVVCCVVVEVSKIADELYHYELNLILDNREYINITELHTVQAGLEEATLRMKQIIANIDNDE